MEFAFSEQEEQLRAQVQAFIAEEFTPEVLADLSSFKLGRGFGPLAAQVMQKIRDRGWVAHSWPKEYGGQGAARTAQFVIEEEFYRAAQIVVGGGGTGAPAIIASGSEEQKRFFIPRVIRREITFCLGFSEPQCGSDLAGVRCRAARVGDKYRINGQKTFTTNAHVATHIFLLVRSDPDSHRQQGLSVLLVPMDTPGITVRPMLTIQNDPGPPPNAVYAEERTNEVFFDDAEVDASCLLGQEGDGWAVSQRGLNLDRVGAFRHLISVQRDEDMVNWLKSDDARAQRLRQDPATLDKVAELWIEGQVCRLMTMRSISIEQRGGNFAYEGSAEKVFAPEHGMRASEVYDQLLGAPGQLLNGSPDAIEGGLFSHSQLGAFQSTINHGSVQVMRNQIAGKALELPRGRKRARPEK